MTTYAERESSVSDSQPIELYQFSRDDGDVSEEWLYANSEAHVTFGDKIYSATAGIHRSTIQQNGESTAMQVTIDLPRLACVTDALSGPRSPAPIKLTLYRWQRGLGAMEFAIIYQGEITGSVFEGSMVQLTCVAEESAWSDGLCRTFCQRSCPFMLYDHQCGADKTARTHDLKITAISMDLLTVTVDDAADTDDPDGGDRLVAMSHYFVNGFMTHLGREIFITGQDGHDLTLQTPLLDAVVDDIVKGTAGCDRTMTDCDETHENGDRFGGFQKIPDRSPWQGVN